MKRLLAMTALIGALGACGYTAEEVREQPARWSNTYPRPWDEMANCIAANQATQSPDMRVTPTLNPAERRAVVAATTGFQGYSSTVWQYDLYAVPGGTQVNWKRRPADADLIGMEPKARQIADQCGARR